MTQPRPDTLYADSVQQRYFHIPDGTLLPAGPMMLRTITGNKMSVEPDSVAFYEVPQETARAVLKVAFTDVLQGVKGFFANLPKPSEAKGRDREREARVAQGIGVDSETLVTDPDAVLDGIKGVFDQLAKQVAAAPVDAPAAAGLDDVDPQKAGTELAEAIRGAIARVATDPKFLSGLETASRELRAAAADVREQTELSKKARRLQEESDDER